MTNFQRNARLAYYVLSSPTNSMPIFIGDPGGGKTDLFSEVASYLDAFFLDLIPAQMSPEDFNGWPTPTPTGLRFEMLGCLRDANRAPRALVLLDEMSNVPRSTQAAMLRFIRTRRSGDDSLAPTVMLAGAMNPPSSSADAQEIAAPLANRVIWLPWKDVTAEEHADYVLRRSVPEPFDLPANTDHERYWRVLDETAAIYAAFIRRRGVIRESPDDPSVAGRFPLAYATPRSWEAFVRVAATCRMNGDRDAMLTIGEGTVGKPQALEFCSFESALDLPDPEEWLVKPDLFAHDPKRPDRTFAAITSLALAATDDRFTERLSDADRLGRWNAACGCLRAIHGTGAGKDVLAVAAQQLAMRKPRGGVLASVQDLIEILRPVIRAAGITASN